MRGDREQRLGEGLSIFERWQARSLTRVAWRGVWRRGVWLPRVSVLSRSSKNQVSWY